jgi:hypothetical protein
MCNICAHIRVFRCCRAIDFDRQSAVMAAAFIITLEKELPEAQTAYAKAGNGKSLAREESKLDLAARTKKVPAITALLSESPAKLIAQMKAEGFDPSRMRLPPEQWFSAADGLATVRALIEYLNANFNTFKQPNPLLKDLKAVEALLVAADSAGVRFHFTRADV